MFLICARQELCLDGGHCGLGKWVQTMCLVKFEIDPGRNTIDVKWNLHISLSNGHRTARTSVNYKNFGCQVCVREDFEPFDNQEDDNHDNFLVMARFYT